MSRRLLLGIVVAAHGVRGEVKIKTFTGEPEALAAYGPLESEDGSRALRIARLRPIEGGVVAAFEGIAGRSAAEALKGMRLYVARERLPQPEADAFYHADLIGLAAETVAGRPLGPVVAVQNFGAGDLIEVALDGDRRRAVLVPFTRAAVPLIDVAQGRIVMDPPEGLIEAE